jgi:hypothetical protein
MGRSCVVAQMDIGCATAASALPTGEANCKVSGGIGICIHRKSVYNCDDITCNPDQANRCDLCKRRKDNCAASKKGTCPNARGLDSLAMSLQA